MEHAQHIARVEGVWSICRGGGESSTATAMNLEYPTPEEWSKPGACARHHDIAMLCPMPNPLLLQAIHRLDQAITRAEATLDAISTQETQQSGRRDAMIAEAMTEIEDLIALIRKSEHG